MPLRRDCKASADNPEATYLPPIEVRVSGLRLPPNFPFLAFWQIQPKFLIGCRLAPSRPWPHKWEHRDTTSRGSLCLPLDELPDLGMQIARVDTDLRKYRHGLRKMRHRVVRPPGGMEHVG